MQTKAVRPAIWDTCFQCRISRLDPETRTMAMKGSCHCGAS
jgi:hypothetical protein